MVFDFWSADQGYGSGLAILLIERGRPLRETLFGESRVLNRGVLAKAIEIPSFWIRPPSFYQSHRFHAITGVAERYGVPTKRLTEQVTRYLERFP